MNFKGVELCCPRCHGELDKPRDDQLACLSCNHQYPVVLDIPDLRIFPDPYIEPQEERAKAARIAERFAELDFAGLVEFYYSITPRVPAHHAKSYARSLLVADARARGWLADWEKAGAAEGTNPEAFASCLDLGCGTAPLLAAANRYGLRTGVDIAFRWLVVGKKRLMEAGLDLPLICACAEALPFRDASFQTVAADSAIEHFSDQRRALAEVHRVMHSGGSLYLATPNRFSLGPDPQTGIWAGSLLPLSWTQAIVRRQGGVPPLRNLLSAGKLRSLLREAGLGDVQIYLPGIPADQRVHFPPMMQRMIRAYEWARRLPVIRQFLFQFGPLFHAVAHKP